MLDTYSAEHIPHLRHFLDVSMELGKVICLADSQPPPPPPRLGPGLLHPDCVEAGLSSVQALVRGAGDPEPRLLDDLLGGGGCLLLADPALAESSAVAVLIRPEVAVCGTARTARDIPALVARYGSAPRTSATMAPSV